MTPGEDQGKANSRTIYLAQVDDGPIKIGFADHPEAELRKMRRDWQPMEIEFLGATPGDESTIALLRSFLRTYRIDEDWYQAGARELVLDVFRKDC